MCVWNCGGGPEAPHIPAIKQFAITFINFPIKNV